MSQLKAAILIVSETAAKDPSSDKCGDVLKDVFDKDNASQWHVQTVDIVPDSILDVQRFIQRWADSEDAVNLIVTSGGTGFTLKDTTPEVTFIQLVFPSSLWLTLPTGCEPVNSQTCAGDCVRILHQSWLN